MDAEQEQEVAVTDPAAAIARKTLEERCAAASIKITEEDHPFDEGSKYLAVHLPDGRESRSLPAWNLRSIESLLAVPFERFVYLSPYEAICSYTKGEIESLVTSADRMPLDFLRRRLLGVRTPPTDEDAPFDFQVPGPDGTSIALSAPSPAIRTLIRRGERATLSLKIKGLRMRTHDGAVTTLTKLSDSLFFQMDLSLGVAVNLARTRLGPGSRLGRRSAEGGMSDIQFPTTEYDPAPMSLYWYGRSASGMPLLRFLAFYQVIEFYFPTYFQAEARKRVRRILKDPGFRADRDGDIGRVLAALSYRGGTYGDERSMFRATLVECIDADELRAFLTADEGRKEFFTSKSKGLSSHKLPIANPTADLRNDVADRLYEIRCRIVHSKSDGREGDADLLLPFSREAEELSQDITVIHYLAQQVLVSASAPLRIQ